MSQTCGPSKQGNASYRIYFLHQTHFLCQSNFMEITRLFENEATSEFGIQPDLKQWCLYLAPINHDVPQG